jgi:hypothetical protein
MDISRHERHPLMGDQSDTRSLLLNNTGNTSTTLKRVGPEISDFGAVLHEVRIGTDSSCDKLFHLVCCTPKNITIPVEIVS